MGNFQARRYVGGKQPEKYFKEDLYPSCDAILLKLSIDEARGYKIFKCFVAMDTDESESVDIEECFAYLGGNKTRFTERIFMNIEGRYDKETAEKGLDYQNFAIVLWNYCTLTPAGLARYVWEIFDIDQTRKLEKPDVETMYKMLYDCDDHDEYFVSQFPFNPIDETISKKDFIDHARVKKHLIQPAIDYQARLRKKLGGFVMWQLLTAFRKRKFAVHDSESPTIPEALRAILNSEEVKKIKKEVDADDVLEQQKAKHEIEQAALAKELKQREFYLAMQKKKEALRPEDKVIQDSWDELDSLKADFADTKWTIEKLEKKIRARNDIYDVYYKASALYKIFWKKKEDKEIELTIGTDDDHKARMRDYCKTRKGSFVFKRTKLMHAFRLVIERFVGDALKGSKSGKLSATRRKGKAEIACETAMESLQNVINKEKELEELMLVDAAMAKAKIRIQDEKEAKLTEATIYGDESDVAKRWATAKEMDLATKKAEDELFAIIKEKTLKEMEESIAKQREERRRFLLQKEFDIKTNFGSPDTKWEQIYDKKNDKYLYYNTETQERKHIKTAICEMCDAVFAQSEVKCGKCDAPRSAKNQKLFRPLGYGNITDE